MPADNVASAPFHRKLFSSLALMLPWPLVATVLTPLIFGSFESAWDPIAFFVGLPFFASMQLGNFWSDVFSVLPSPLDEAGEIILIVAFLFAWALLLIVPNLFASSRSRWVLTLQSTYSLLCAVLGYPCLFMIYAAA